MTAVESEAAGFMSDEAFADLRLAMEAALAFERGERRDQHITRITTLNQPTDPDNDQKNRSRTRRFEDGAMAS